MRGTHPTGILREDIVRISVFTGFLGLGVSMGSALLCCLFFFKGQADDEFDAGALIVDPLPTSLNVYCLWWIEVFNY